FSPHELTSETVPASVWNLRNTRRWWEAGRSARLCSGRFRSQGHLVNFFELALCPVAERECRSQLPQRFERVLLCLEAKRSCSPHGENLLAVRSLHHRG